VSDPIAREALDKLREAIELAQRYKAENEHLEQELGAAIKHAQYVMSLLEAELKTNEKLEGAYLALRGILTEGLGSVN
jgi:Cdc6-like AAA superfamily ATPase